MNVTSVNQVQHTAVRPQTEKVGVLLAQKSLEAAQRNQTTAAGTRQTTVAKPVHPYLGRHIDVYV